MNALEKYAAKKKLTKEYLARMLYGKKPVEGKKFRRIGAGVGAYGGSYAGGVAGSALTSAGRAQLKANKEMRAVWSKMTKAEKAEAEAGWKMGRTSDTPGLDDAYIDALRAYTAPDAGKAALIGLGGAGIGGLLGGKAGHMGGKALDKALLRKELGKYRKRQLKTNVGIGAGVGGAGGLAALLASNKG